MFEAFFCCFTILTCSTSLFLKMFSFLLCNSKCNLYMVFCFFLWLVVCVLLKKFFCRVLRGLLQTFTLCFFRVLVGGSVIPFIFKKYKTFSVLIYSYINTSGNWKNEKLRRNTTPAGRSVFTQFRVFPIFASVDITVYQYGKNALYFFYNIAQRTLTEEWREIFRVDIVISTRLLANQRSEFTNAILYK